MKNKKEKRKKKKEKRKSSKQQRKDVDEITANQRYTHTS